MTHHNEGDGREDALKHNKPDKFQKCMTNWVCRSNLPNKGIRYYYIGLEVTQETWI